MRSKRTLGTCLTRAAVAVLSIAILAVPSIVRADNESDAHEHAGLSIGGDASYFRNPKDVDSGWYGGADLRLQFAPAIAIDGSTVWKQDHAVNDFPTQASLMIFLTPQERLSPYILGGGTWYLENGGGATGSQFGPDAGAGLEFFLSRDWSIDANWRYLWIENPNSGSNYFNRSYSANSWQAMAGLHFHF